VRRAGLAALLSLATLAPAHAHKPSDSFVTLNLAPGDAGVRGHWDVSVRDLDEALALDRDRDASVTWGEIDERRADIERLLRAGLTLRAPQAACSPDPSLAGVIRHDGEAFVRATLAFVCPPGALTIDYRLFGDVDRQHRGLVRIEGAGESTLVVGHGRPTPVVTRSQAARVSLATFVREGVLHIWGGFDHVLFLLALLLPAVVRREGRSWREAAALRPALGEVARIVTAFTVAHSLTLGLAASGVVQLPGRLVEPAIALSVLVAAIDNLHPLFKNDRWAIAFVLGLLHGFGFSSSLAALGSAGSGQLVSLLGFNLGVELGQLALVAAFVPLAFAARRTPFYRRGVLQMGSLAISLTALVWFCQRAFTVSTGS
jgi:hypothetical protein